MACTEFSDILLCEDGVVEFRMQGLVVACCGCIVGREGEAVYHVAEDIGATVGTQHFCHVGQGLDDFLRDVHISVLADSVLLLKQSVVYMYVAGSAIAAHEDAEVFVRDAVVGHVLLSEVKHHAEGGVVHQINAGVRASLAETTPEVGLLVVGGVRHLGCRQIHDGVCQHDIGVAAHVLSANWWVGTVTVTAGQILHYDGVVKHTGVNQQLLLCQRQVLQAILQHTRKSKDRPGVPEECTQTISLIKQ